MNVKTRREMIEEAFDEEERDTTSGSGDEASTVDAAASTEGDATASNESTAVDGSTEGGEEATSEYQKEAKADETASTRTVADPKAVVKDDPEKQPLVTDQEAAQRAGNAPLSWRPESKTSWQALPAHVREDITKREVETQRALTYSAGARKFAQDFQQVVQPYGHLIQAQNSTPLQAVKNLMNTAAGLTVGNPQQKADIVTEIILNYGLDLEILDKSLSAAVQKKGQNVQQQIPPHLMTALKPVFDAANRLTEREQQEAERLQISAEEAVVAMENDTVKYPFFNQLRQDIADIMEIAARRGTRMTMDQAYQRAVRMDDRFSKADQQRKSGNAVQQAARTLAAARNRRSATTGSPTSGAGDKPTPKNRRETIEQAWDSAGDR